MCYVNVLCLKLNNYTGYTLLLLCDASIDTYLTTDYI